MGLGKNLLANTTKIGQAAGHCFPNNSFVTIYDETIKGASYSGGSHPQLKITSSEGEFTFGHEDVEMACICCCGMVGTKANGGPIIGTKYRVVLKDGKEFILTALDNNSYYFERVLF